MEKEQIKSLLEIIDQQVSSSILGGMEETYEELERLGYIVIHTGAVQHSASMTEKGLAYLQELHRE
ncbi:hypothetical protein [Pedobacter nutrimenti]|jgi:hypothetical protein|uniref:Uncharacterized protein n=1 Tax=Pedobacter nutrimenti TaxID=1241337 RepID=A0A318UMH7_9SPHI|nr:hypothetical protein [Pedobacter nutrimenti]PYF70698.1 hypothetical protein B0O44_108124 [Pedobacter nutrimenti]